MDALYLVGIAVLAVFGFVLAVILFNFFGLWLRARIANAPVSLGKMVGMRLRKVPVVGGSAGGCLALWCALDPASTVSGWDENARSHIKAVVSFSGPTDFCDWSNPGGIPPDKLTDFENDLDNYVNLLPQTDCAHDPNGNLEHASPYWLVTNGATSNPPPVRLYSTQGDPVPYSQALDMQNALRSQFPSLDVQRYTMSYAFGTQHDHAYHYWHALNDDPASDGLCVSQEVISFLQSH